MRRVIIESVRGLYHEAASRQGPQSYLVAAKRQINRGEQDYTWYVLRDEAVLKQESYLYLEEIPPGYPRDYLLYRDNGMSLDCLKKDARPLTVDILHTEVIAEWDQGTRSYIGVNGITWQLIDSFEYSLQGRQNWRFIWVNDGGDSGLIVDLIIGGEKKIRVANGIFLYAMDVRKID